MTKSIFQCLSISLRTWSSRRLGQTTPVKIKDAQIIIVVIKTQCMRFWDVNHPPGRMLETDCLATK